MVFQAILRHVGSFSHPVSGALEGVSVDSRSIRSGELFFALPGEVSDGHLHLAEVASKGAFGAVIRKDFHGVVPNKLPVVRVEDPLRTLQDLAKERVRQVGASVVAVTGSMGKTTTKDFMRTMLSMNGIVTSTQGNQNSQIGMALSLLNGIRGDEKFLVVEMGMTQPGHIRRLVEIVPPDVAIVTAVSLVHAANFSGIEDIARAKAEIFSSQATEWNIYNADTSCADILEACGHGKKRSFSLLGNPQAFWSMELGENFLRVFEGGRGYTLPCPIFPARHVYENLLAAIAGVRSAGLSWDEIEESLPLLTLPKMRLEKKRCAGIWFINDSYNASEASMMAALDVLSGHSSARKVAVLGQMNELGSISIPVHQRVGEKALASADRLYCLGTSCAPMVEPWHKAQKACFWAASLEELVEKLKIDLCSGDVVLLKGSHSNHLWKIVDAFSERTCS